MNDPDSGKTIFVIAVSIIALVLGISALLMPLWVLSIRGTIIEVLRELRAMTRILESIERPSKANESKSPPFVLPPAINTKPPASFPSESGLHIGQGGKHLGKFRVDEVVAMLGIGKLSWSDHYYDKATDQWIPLSECPDLK